MKDAAKTNSPSSFPTTQWGDILSKRGDTERRELLLAELCKQYWRPLFLFARFRGLSVEAAEDAVQDVFAKLVASDFLEALDPARGRLRSYLRKVMDNTLSHRREKASARKRGGSKQIIPLDHGWAERSLADSTSESPEQAYDRSWARQVMDAAFSRLEQEYRSGYRKGPFEVIKAVFAADAAPAYGDVAAKYDMSLPQVKSFVHRGRVRFRELVLEEVSRTVAHTTDAQAEMSSLIAALYSS